ncbi:Ni-sirohydrochlorin a,c-diamide synthase [Methanocella arvoryzae]|uniref:Cobyrinate a,c-diamide synthase n=1 Tax=Methanocella arvoryzae (strain DSM 22066 / NBRC 105507 / MRE50) TaxID=351160 RepID=Q0W386_METAR|nr:Ni-sirohydrochlorin a,c-diamide synthase [Methanocella arvoryzae]CAJ37157.1 cobyrinic acid a,c-diamide synthase [Methanocella arvoryzae MRE50]
MIKIPRVILAGDRSSAGKTTISVGIMALLKEQGKTVQPFKVGLDYIDPSYHSMITGKQGGNLDGYLMSDKAIAEAFVHSSEGSDISIIEGVRGLYEGLESLSDVGSTAQIAKVLKTPVILIVDAQSITRSTAAIVKGYRDFDRGVNIRGVILNKIGSERHAEKARMAIEKYTGVEVLGAIPRSNSMKLTMRHLGLIPAREGASRVEGFDSKLEKIKETIRDNLNLKRIVEIAAGAPPLREPKPDIFVRKNPGGVRIGLALDEAFNFYYKDNIDLLQCRGAEIVHFSPVNDAGIPEVDGLIIGGGYPEVFAAELAQNEAMRKSIFEASRRGMPIYAECGGLMYLMKSLETEDGSRHDMAGVFEGVASMKHVRTIGYVSGRFAMDTPIGQEGALFKGHEFHHSVITDLASNARFACRLDRGTGIHNGLDGIMSDNTLATYTHLHAASYVPFSGKFVESCAVYHEKG